MALGDRGLALYQVPNNFSPIETLEVNYPPVVNRFRLDIVPWADGNFDLLWHDVGHDDSPGIPRNCVPS